MSWVYHSRANEKRKYCAAHSVCTGIIETRVEQVRFHKVIAVRNSKLLPLDFQNTFYAKVKYTTFFITQSEKYIDL